MTPCDLPGRAYTLSGNTPYERGVIARERSDRRWVDLEPTAVPLTWGEIGSWIGFGIFLAACVGLMWVRL
jgi:hypothetical protein